MPPAPAVVLVIFAVRDLRRMTAFYRAVFDWPQAVDVPVYAELTMPNGQRLGLYAEDAFATNTGLAPSAAAPAGAITRTELYLLCDDLDASIARAAAAGARVLSPVAPRPWGDDAAYFADPEGNVLVLARPRAA